MNYIKSILGAFKLNKNVLYKLVPTLAIVFSLTYLPHVILVYTIRILCLGFAVMSLITLIYIGIKDNQFIKKKHINKQEEPTMTTFIILAKRHTQTIQLSCLAENMRAAIDEFRLTYPKKHYTIIDCKEATNYNRQLQLN